VHCSHFTCSIPLQWFRITSYLDDDDSLCAAREALKGWLEEGKLVQAYRYYEGLESAPACFEAMFAGTRADVEGGATDADTGEAKSTRGGEDIRVPWDGGGKDDARGGGDGGDDGGDGGGCGGDDRGEGEGDGQVGRSDTTLASSVMGVSVIRVG